MSAYDYYEFYLEVKDLKDKAHVVTIERIRVGEFYNQRDRKTDKKFVLSFVNRRKKMVLNKTQASAVMDIAGTDDEKKWIGVELVLTGGRAVNGKDTIVITNRAESGDLDLMYPPVVKPLARNRLIPVSSLEYKELFDAGCDQLGLAKNTSAQILVDCENDYKTATERLTEEYGDNKVP